MLFSSKAHVLERRAKRQLSPSIRQHLLCAIDLQENARAF